MSQQPTGPACGNNPNHQLTPGDRQAVADFKAYLQRLAEEEQQATHKAIRYRRRPAEIDAMQWTGDNADALRAFAGSDFDTIEVEDRIDDPDCDAQLLVEDSHWVAIRPGEWVLKFEGYFLSKSDEAFRTVWEPAVSPPADRAAVLREAADAIQDVIDADRAYSPRRSNDRAALGAARQIVLGLIDRPRRMADEAQP